MFSIKSVQILCDRFEAAGQFTDRQAQSTPSHLRASGVTNGACSSLNCGLGDVSYARFSLPVFPCQHVKCPEVADEILPPERNLRTSTQFLFHWKPISPRSILRTSYTGFSNTVTSESQRRSVTHHEISCEAVAALCRRFDPVELK
jgi:hypothetical protein